MLVTFVYECYCNYCNSGHHMSSYFQETIAIYWRTWVGSPDGRNRILSLKRRVLRKWEDKGYYPELWHLNHYLLKCMKYRIPAHTKDLSRSIVNYPMFAARHRLAIWRQGQESISISDRGARWLCGPWGHSWISSIALATRVCVNESICSGHGPCRLQSHSAIRLEQTALSWTCAGWWLYRMLTGNSSSFYGFLVGTV
jgi:hypothetical protein